MKQKKFLLPMMAVIFAVGGAFATNALKAGAVLTSVEYKNAANVCVTHPQCTTTPAATPCSNTFKAATSCSTSIASWRP